MTRFQMPALMLLSLAVLFGAARPAHAAESYDNCTGFIITLPAIISTQGTWCLKQDLTTAIASGDAITISTNNVTIDCNNFKLGGLPAGTGTSAIGIYSLNRQNASVRHCNIRGFYRGIFFNSSGGGGGGNVIEDNRFDGNTFVGIDSQGDGSVIRRNHVFDTGGSTVSPNAVYALLAYGSVDVLDNTISGAAVGAGSNGSVYGIYTSGNSNGSVRGNRVRGLVKSGTGAEFAIYNFASDRIALHDNDLAGDATAGGIGLICSSTNARARDNTINGFATAINGCGDAGGNDITP
jgi:hypothetical protein